jgi:hypothetical protein
MTDRKIETGRCYGIGMNVEKNFGENVKETIPMTDYNSPETTKECRIFKLFG